MNFPQSRLNTVAISVLYFAHLCPSPVSLPFPLPLFLTCRCWWAGWARRGHRHLDVSSAFCFRPTQIPRVQSVFHGPVCELPPSWTGSQAAAGGRGLWVGPGCWSVPCSNPQQFPPFSVWLDLKKLRVVVPWHCQNIYHTPGGLGQQTFILSEVWKPESKTKVLAGLPSLLRS